MSSTVDINEYSVLPEDCVACITGFTTPGDACRLATVSKMVQSAAESDPVWERFLPPDYRHLIARSDDGDSLLLEYRSKKQLYLRLADSQLLIDGSTKSFWIDKSNGKKCFMISARSLSITWTCTPKYWRWISVPESRFPDVAELLHVCWLEIRGKFKTSLLSSTTNYWAYLVYRLTPVTNGLDGHTEASVVINGRKISTRKVLFEFKDYRQHRSRTRSTNQEIDDRYPNSRDDGWLEMKIGSFFSDTGEDEVELSVTEIKHLNWKSGLIVEGIELRPDEAKCTEINVSR